MRIRIGYTEYEVLNKKTLRPINTFLINHFGASLPEGFAYLKSTKENVYLMSRWLAQLPLAQLRINSVGLYVGEITNAEFRLSIEGSQIIGPKVTKNVVALEKKELEQWMRGEPVPKETTASGYVIIRYGDDYLGSGRVKDGQLLNFVPKTRRVKELA